MDKLMIFLLIGVCVPMVVSDFRRREIHTLWLGAFGTVVFVMAVVKYGLMGSLTNAVWNIGMIAYLSLSIIGYLKIKHKRSVNPLQEYVGLGDLLFFICLSPLWGMKQYLIFIIISLIGTLLYWTIHKIVSPKLKTIPLVGTVGIALCGYVAI